MQPYVVVSLVCAGINAFGAFRKNRNPIVWGLLGAMIPLTVLIVAFLPFLCPECSKPLTNDQWRKRTCPDCGDLRDVQDHTPEHEDMPELPLEERRNAVQQALATKDPVQVVWATNELEHLPSVIAEQIARENGIEFTPRQAAPPPRTKTQQRRREEEATSRLSKATKTEIRGRVQEALAAYQEIIDAYPDTQTAEDARISLQILKKKMG
jgi:hypothetical protein